MVQGVFLKIFTLLVFIVVLIFLGLFVVSRIGIFHVKNETFERVTQFLGLGPTQSMHKGIMSSQVVDYDRSQAEREKLEQWESSLREVESNFDEKNKSLEQRLIELDARELELFQKEENIKKTLKMYESSGNGMRLTAESLINIPPEKAVDILLNMDDTGVIEIFNTVNTLSKERSVASLVSVWMQIMPPVRVADIVRKMSLD